MGQNNEVSIKEQFRDEEAAEERGKIKAGYVGGDSK